MADQINMTAKVGKKGIIPSQPDRLADFLARHSGREVTLHLEVLHGAPTEAMITYFTRVVVPEFRMAFYDSGERYTEQRTKEIILGFCPAAVCERYDKKAGRYLYEVKPLEELSHHELSEVIDTLKEVLAENFGRFIK